MAPTSPSESLPCAVPEFRESNPVSPITHLAVLDAQSSPPLVVRQLFEGGDWCIAEHAEVSEDDRPAAFRRFDVALLVDHGSGRPGRTDSPMPETDHRLELLEQFGMGVLILTSRPWFFAGSSTGTVCLPPDSSLDTVRGALLALSHMRPTLRQIDRQVDNLNRLGNTLRKQFEANDQELQLASRLQHDFLPRQLPQSGPLRFTTLFRPCTWVSGDIFDVFRLDERHWGLYIADAVGHGVAAGLLTMYIKHAIRPKRIHQNTYELVAPAEVLADLNEQLTSQALPDAQFVTGWYGLINTDTLGLRYAVAGHPPPLLIAAAGDIRELPGDGYPLGLTNDAAFSDQNAELHQGDRVLLYSDGLEEALIAQRRSRGEMPELLPDVADLLHSPAEDLVAQLRDRLDRIPGSLMRADDATAVVVDVV